MDIWNVFEYLAWAISAALIIWMVVDAIKVGTHFDEELLLSSREGLDELLQETAGVENTTGTGESR